MNECETCWNYDYDEEYEEYGEDEYEEYDEDGEYEDADADVE